MPDLPPAVCLAAGEGQAGELDTRKVHQMADAQEGGQVTGQPQQVDKVDKVDKVGKVGDRGLLDSRTSCV